VEARAEKIFDTARDPASEQVRADWKMSPSPVLSKSAESSDIVIRSAPGVLPRPAIIEISREISREQFALYGRFIANVCG